MKLPSCAKTYDNRCVLDLPETELERGRIYAVIGSNGSGKSTLARVLSGCVPADTGRVTLDFSVGYMPQMNYAYRMSTRSNILLGNNDPTRADELISVFQLKSLEKKRADRLSGGETARMALARLMMKKYDLVILDEPTAPMDMESAMIVEQQIRHYVQETECALIMITHSLRQAERLSDDILFFHKGKLIEKSPTDMILHAPKTPELATFLQFYGMQF